MNRLVLLSEDLKYYQKKINRLADKIQISCIDIENIDEELSINTDMAPVDRAMSLLARKLLIEQIHRYYLQSKQYESASVNTRQEMNCIMHGKFGKSVPRV